MITLEQVRARRGEILVLAAQNKVRDVRIIGSVARGEEHSGSDLDLLVLPNPGASLLDLIGFEQALEELLGLPVQVASERGLYPHIERTVLRDATPL